MQSLNYLERKLLATFIFHRKVKNCIETFIPCWKKQKFDKIIISFSADNKFLLDLKIEDRLVRTEQRESNRSSSAIETRGIT